jgi:hypothetical protein
MDDSSCSLLYLLHFEDAAAITASEAMFFIILEILSERQTKLCLITNLALRNVTDKNK